VIRTPILIVGAGPSGLMLSAQLLRYGADHVIIDKKSSVTNQSRALAVQARTLEQYRQLGIAERALAEGFIAPSARFVVNGRVRAMIPLGEIGTGLAPYPYLFILEQSRNEALLLEHVMAMHGGVQWDTELVDVGRADAGYCGTLRRADGSSEPFECRYLVGCDGASSPVRHFTRLPFRGGTNEKLFFVADIDMEFALEKQGLVLVVNKHEFLAFFPMLRPKQYRAVGVLPPAITDPANVPFDTLRQHIERHTGLAAKVVGHTWHAGYRVHHRISDSFRSGNVFLVGDAAHIHSPAGGQGMNTGLGDAVNLGWKLAGVVNNWCDPKILDSYNDERRPFGAQLVHTTDRAFTLMVSKNWFPRLIRTHLVPRMVAIALRFQQTRRLMFKTISQTRISYRKSPLSDGTYSGPLHSGDRFPWFTWADGNSFDWLRSAGYVVLTLGGAHALSVPGWTGPSTVIDVTGAALAAAIDAGLPPRGCVVVRPDMHVATIADG